MAVLYKVKDWGRHFENNRTRNLKHMDWVPLPNKLDGDGYTELVSHADGAAHFGAWVACVEVASKCDPRGTLVREGARPHDPASLARITRIPKGVFEQAIPRLLSIGWLSSEVVVSTDDTQIPQDDASSPHESAADSHGTDYGREGKGTERNGTPLPPAARGASTPDGAEGETPGFIRFWSAWPSHFRKKGRSKCARTWKREGLEKITDRIVVAVEKFKTSPQWRREGGQYIPGPMKWLTDESWEVPAESLAELADESPEGDANGFVRKSEAEIEEVLRGLEGT